MSRDGTLPDGVSYHDLPGCSREDEARENDHEKAIEEWDAGEGKDALAEAREEDHDLAEAAFAEQWIAARTEELSDAWGEDEGPEYERDADL
jgi:hypothetical protein